MPGRKLFSLLLSLSWAVPASAHVFKRSYVDARATESGLAVLFDIDPDDFDETLHARFDNDRSGAVDGSELGRHAGVVGGIVAAGMVVSRGGERCRADVTETRVSEAAQMIRVQLLYSCAQAGALAVDMALFDRFRAGHTQLLTMRLPEGVSGSVLTHERPFWRQATLWGEVWRFLLLGLEHILVGYDHLLFLLALLLVPTRLRDLLAIVTSFTVAHSLTLLGAALGAFRMPSSIVEPAIAATIVYVGVENFLLESARRRWLLTFALGLVHGFGFAGLVAEMGLPKSGGVLALLAFNVGVEIGQAGAVVAVAPALVALRHSALTRRKQAVIGLGALLAAALLSLASPLAAAALALMAAAAIVLVPRYSFRRVVLQGGSALVTLLGAAWLVSRIADAL